MKLLQFLPLAALGAAFLFDQSVFYDQLPYQEQALQCPKHRFEEAKENAVNPFDEALEYTGSFDDAAYGWVGPDFDANFEGFIGLDGLGYRRWLERGRRLRHCKPSPPRHQHKSNKTIFQTISESNYTTELAKLISEYDDLVSLLNSTEANYTIFAPTDDAFKKLPKHDKASKELVKRVLIYHIVPGLYPAGRVLFSKTVPTLLHEASLGDEPQRIVAATDFKGVKLNLYSRVLPFNVPAINGLIHGIDSPLVPPPPTLNILSLLTSEFSTLLLGLDKTGLLETLRHSPHAGSTLFAPSNLAFKNLGPKINAFLFSKSGEKYLKALLSYHVVANQTLYQTAFYNGAGKEARDLLPGPEWLAEELTPRVREEAYPYFHFDLPTLFGGRTVSVDVGRYGSFVSIKVNEIVKVAVPDGVAKDGVIHVVNYVLIPPKQVPGADEVSFWEGEEMTVEEFKERLKPLMEKDAGDSDGESSDEEEGEFSALPVEVYWKTL